MKGNHQKAILIFSVVYYVVLLALMGFGTFFDVEIGKAVFQPESRLAVLAEDFGQFVYWGMWGPAFTVLWLRKHSFYELYEFAEKHTVSKKPVQIKKKTAQRLNTVFRGIYSVVFFVLAVVGWKKLIQNGIKNILYEAGKENLSEAVYFLISAAVAVLGLLLFSRIREDTLKKLEGAAIAGICFGCLCKIAEEGKPLTQRVRFREMVAYSNGFLTEDGLSEGKYSPLTRQMVSQTDFSAFTPWYKKGDAKGIYNRADSFPSGHTCYSCTLFLSYIFCTLFEKLKKAAPFWLILSFVYVAWMGYLRMVAGAHYLTDVAAAALIGYTVFLLVYAVYTRFVRKPGLNR